MECTVDSKSKDDTKQESSPGCQSQSVSDRTKPTVCPLFMDGLPSDFADNPGLAAIASLLEEDEEENKAKKKSNLNDDDDEGNVCLIGGGKTSKIKKKNRSTPYSFKGKKKESKPSIGEAQLFLKMWKL